MDLGKRQYFREKYACHLGISKKRVTPDGHLKDPVHVASALTKWLARCVRDQGAITGSAHVEPNLDLMTDRWILRAWGYASLVSNPDHLETLRSLIDRPGFDVLEIPG